LPCSFEDVQSLSAQLPLWSVRGDLAQPEFRSALLAFLLPAANLVGHPAEFLAAVSLLTRCQTNSFLPPP
jgi:hypothetical protein